MKKIAVIILNYNGEKYLKKFLHNVINRSPEADVIIADNGSKDNSVSYLCTKHPTITTLTFDKNYGFAEGYNKAIQSVTHEFVVLLNSDVEVTEHWLQPMYSYLQNHSDVAAAQPKILSYYDKQSFEYAGASGGFIDKYGYPFCRGRILNEKEKDKGQYDSICDIFWASGCALFIRRSIYLKEGGLDSTFFAHQEEIDLCWRLKARNYRIVCIPQSTIYHIGAGTLNYDSPFKTFLNFRNNSLLLYKNLPQKEFKKIMLLRYFLDLMAAFHLLIMLQPKNALQVIKARWAFRALKKEFKEKRTFNLENSKVNKIKEQLNHCILLEVYIKKHKLFSEIIDANDQDYFVK